MEDSQVEQAIHDLGNNPTLANFISKFSLFTQAPNGISKLRELILFAAVSGKLTHKETEADIEDEIQQALAYKAKYEKELKLRKNTPLASVEIIPYEIPSHWQWVKLEDLACYIQRGKGPKYDDDNSSELVISQKCIQWDGFSLDKSRGVLASSLDKYGEERFLKQGDLLWNSTGTGTVGRIAVIDKNIKEKLVADSHVTVIRLSNMVPRYIWCCITNPWVQDRIEPEHENALVSGSTKQVELSTTAVRGLPIPVAPIEEQKRIVAKVDELMALCDQLEAQQQQQANTLLKANTAAIQALLSSDAPQGSGKDRNSSGTNSANSKDNLKNNWQRLADNFHTLYGNTLPMPPGEGRQKKHLVGLENLKQFKNTILQLAVTGKLVAQDTNETPASVLIEDIADTKQKLIKDKIISKESVFPVIPDEEKPFELPDGWSFVRLGQITNRIGSGSTPRGGKNAYIESGIPFLRSQNVWNDGLRLDDVAYIPDETHEKMSNTKVFPQDILLNITGASLGRCTLIPDDFDEANVSQHVTIIRPTNPETRQYLHLCMLSPHTQNMVWGRQVGMAREGLSKKVLEQFEIPLPPLEEQKRIVAKVNSLMALCDQLEQQLTTAYDQAEKLITTTTKALVA